MISAHSTLWPPSNRGHDEHPQKTNLQILTPSISIDRMRIAFVSRLETCPSVYLNRIYGCHNVQKSARMQGAHRVAVHKAWDSPPQTQGGGYYQAVPFASDWRFDVEWNPNHAPEKLAQILDWSDAHGLDAFDGGYLTRLDIAFDFETPRDRLTFMPSSTRKMSLHGSTDSLVPETASAPHTTRFPGMTLYDKRLERAEVAGERLDRPLTRFELKIRPKFTEAHKLTEIASYELPPIGGELRYMHTNLADYNVNSDQAQFYRLCQTLAQYNPKLAKREILDFASTKGHGAEIFECMCQLIDLQTLWSEGKAEAVRPVRDTLLAHRN